MRQCNLNFTTQAYNLVDRTAGALEAIAKALQDHNKRQAGVVIDDSDAEIALDVVEWAIEEVHAGRTGAPALDDLGALKDALGGSRAATSAAAGGRGTVRWTEVRRTPDGIIVSLYEDADRFVSPAVIDEAAWEWAELAEISEGAVGDVDETTTLAAPGELE